MANMKISVIIPAYNEAARIEKTLKSVHAYLSQKFFDDYEIVVVNDGSTDGTREKVDLLISVLKNLSILNLPENRGKGFAVKAGMQKTTGEIKMFMDADSSTSIDSLDFLLPYLDKGADVIISSRRVHGARILSEQPHYRIFLGWVFRKITQFLTLLDVVDSQNGFKIFRGYVADDVFSRITIFGWAFDVEALVIANRLGYVAMEAPITWQNDSRSKVTFLGMCHMLYDLVVIGIKIRRGIYDKKHDKLGQ